MKTSVRFLAVLFAVVMALFTVGYAADYSDVDGKNTNYDAIELLSTLGVLGGYEDGTFRPNDPVQRDEMAKMVYIMATAFETAGEGVKIFPDVSAKHWASGYIAWSHGKGIVGGYEDGTFRPDDNITYDEALKMACSMLGYTGFKSELWPTDVRAVALKQLKLDENLDELKVEKTDENGMPYTTIDGSAKINRAQAAQIVYNCFYKTMGITQDEEGSYTEENNGAANDVNLVDSKKSMTLAEDVWGLEVIEYKVVATENFGLKHMGYGVDVAKTGKPDEIILWDGEGTKKVSLEELKLEEYEGNTDAIFGFTLPEIYKDGKLLAASGLKGTKYENVSLSKVGAKSTDPAALTHVSGTTYWFNDRINVNGTLYDGENYQNLRAAVVDRNGTFTVYDQIIWNNDRASGAGYQTTNPGGNSVELHFNHYFLDAYFRRAWGIDSEGDGIIDYLFVKCFLPYKVESVVNAAEGSEKYQLVTLKEIITNSIVGTFDSRNITTAAAALKKDDIFVGAVYADRVYVETTIEPQTSYATAVTGSSITLKGIGKLSGNSYFFPHYSNTALSKYIDVSDPGYWINKKADGTYNMVTVWVYKDKVIYSSAYTPEAEARNTAILLYADAKTEPQYNKATKKFETFYPAYLLINGKEEAVNLDPKNAINGSSGDYVAADGSPYRAIVDQDFILHYVYQLVTYEKDEVTGYYSLTTENDSVYNEDDELVELVIPAEDNPKLQYNAATGLFKIVTDNDTYLTVDVDENTYLYYLYTKESTGDYKYIGFYTSDSFTEEFEEVTFASDVYLTYNTEDGFYTIVNGILADKIDSASGVEDFVDYNKDARAVYLAVDSSAMVQYDEAAHYEHTLMNPATGEVKTVVQTEKSIVDGALKLEAGKFYAWDGDEDDYVQVTSDGVDTAVDSVVFNVITTVDLARNIIYTESGEYAEGLKLAEDMVIVGFDDELNRYEYTLEDVAQMLELFDEEGEPMYFMMMTYVDEEGEVQISYIITDYAETVELEDGTYDIELSTDVLDALKGA